MFRSFIYLDEDKLYAYKSIVDGKDTPQNRTYTKTSRTGISSEKLPVSLSTNRETQESGSFSRNIDLDYQKFEERLSNFEGDEYFNFVLNEDQYDYGNLPLMSLIKIRGTIEIPEAFDILNVVQQFKPFLLKSIPQTDVSTELAKEVFTNAKADVASSLKRSRLMARSTRRSSPSYCSRYCSRFSSETSLRYFTNSMERM